jgi:hypothetical protein
LLLLSACSGGILRLVLFVVIGIVAIALVVDDDDDVAIVVDLVALVVVVVADTADVLAVVGVEVNFVGCYWRCCYCSCC